MLADLTSRQLTEWRLYEELDPDESSKMDWRFALLCATVTDLVIHAVGGKKAKGRQPTSPGRFYDMFSWNNRVVMIDGIAARKSDKPTARQSIKDMKQFMMGFVGKKKTAPQPKKGGQ